MRRAAEGTEPADRSPPRRTSREGRAVTPQPLRIASPVQPEMSERERRLARRNVEKEQQQVAVAVAKSAALARLLAARNSGSAIPQEEVDPPEEAPPAAQPAAAVETPEEFDLGGPSTSADPRRLLQQLQAFTAQ